METLRDENKNTVEMARRPDVEEQLERLHSRLCRLESLAADLGPRLSSVMRDPEPCPADENKGVPAHTVLGRDIAIYRNRIGVVADCLEDIHNRLELGNPEPVERDSFEEQINCGTAYVSDPDRVHPVTGPRNPPRPRNDYPRG